MQAEDAHVFFEGFLGNFLPPQGHLIESAWDGMLLFPEFIELVPVELDGEVGHPVLEVIIWLWAGHAACKTAHIRWWHCIFQVKNKIAWN